MPISSTQMLVTHHATNDLEQTFEYLSNSNFDDEYTVAWIDTLNNHRSIVMTAHHLADKNTSKLNYTASHYLTIPFNLPAPILNSSTLKIFNQFYYRTQSKKTLPFATSLNNYFYPLDTIKHWNRLYSKRGFIQYQCVLPTNKAYIGIQQILNKLAATSYPAFLGVLKRFSAANLGYLSFPMAGFTLAIDIPILDTGLFSVLENLDEIVIENEGRIYLAKDARLKPNTFRAMYPRYAEWLAIKNKLDPNHLFSSSLSRRLEIGQ